MAQRRLAAPDLPIAIGEVRRRTGMTSRAIRFYEDQGLIRTSRNHRGLRGYDEVAVNRLLYVGQARQAGLSIAQISQLLTVADHDGESELVTRTLELYRARLVDLQAQVEAVEASAQALGVSLRPKRPKLVALRA
jgi:DNA-binding transcriptional MerR regulator